MGSVRDTAREVRGVKQGSWVTKRRKLAVKTAIIVGDCGLITQEISGKRDKAPISELLSPRAEGIRVLRQVLKMIA